MKNFEFQSLLGKKINEANALGAVHKNNFDDYYRIKDPRFYFHKKKIDLVLLKVSEDTIIEHIFIYFLTAAIDNLFETICRLHGGSHKIMEPDQELEKSTDWETNEEGFTSYLSESFITLKEGSIYDTDIQYIKWDMPDFNVTIYCANKKYPPYLMYSINGVN